MTPDDVLYSRAVDLVITHQKASVSLIQRSLQIGFSQAAGYLDEMQALGIVSAPNALGQRMVLIGSGTQAPPEHSASTHRSAAHRLHSRCGAGAARGSGMTKRDIGRMGIRLFSAALATLVAMAVLSFVQSVNWETTLMVTSLLAIHLSQRLRDFLESVDLVSPGGQQEEQEKNDHGAGLIHQTIPDVAETEPRLDRDEAARKALLDQIELWAENRVSFHRVLEALDHYVDASKMVTDTSLLSPREKKCCRCEQEALGEPAKTHGRV